MPSLLVDIYKTKDLYSGLGQFSYNFAKYLCKYLPENFELSLLTEKKMEGLDPAVFKFITANWKKRYFPALNRSYDLWHSLHQFPSHMPSKNSKQILTIHDLNFLVEKNKKKAEKEKQDKKEEEESPHVTFIQKEVKCFCCGKPGHASHK